MTESPVNQADHWSLFHRIAFRFAAIFLSLYILPFPFDKVPGVHVLAQGYSKAWHAIAVWVGDHALNLPQPITHFNDGGDKMYDYVFLLIVTVLALFTTAVWSFLDRRRLSYPVGYYWVQVWVRYYLGSVFVFYGMIKVFHLQMPSPTLFELVEPFGNKTPMGLAWSYVGFSPVFSAFVGMAEVIAGILLFFRRTMTLGALIGGVVMLNVVVMNLTFHVPVKLYSSVLFFMIIFLVLPDVGRLTRMLVLNKPTEAIKRRQFLKTRWLRNTAIVVKILFITTVVIGNVAGCFQRTKTSGDGRERSPLYGIYNVTQFIVNGDTLAPLTTDSIRWRQLITDFPDHAHVKLMNDSIAYYPVVWDTLARSLTVTAWPSTKQSILQLEKTSDLLRLHGTMGLDSVEIKLRRRDLESFPLKGTRFRWIQEYP